MAEIHVPPAYPREGKYGEPEDTHSFDELDLFVGQSREDNDDRFCPLCRIGKETVDVTGSDTPNIIATLAMISTKWIPWKGAEPSGMRPVFETKFYPGAG